MEQASPTERRWAWFRSMVLIRAFEDKVQQLFMQGLVAGTTHLAQGQEAIPVGACSPVTQVPASRAAHAGLSLQWALA